MSKKGLKTSKILQISCSWDSKLGGPVQVARYVSKKLRLDFPKAETWVVGKFLNDSQQNEEHMTVLKTLFKNRYGFTFRLLNPRVIRSIRNQDLIICHGYYLFTTLVALIFARNRILVMPHGSLEIFISKKGISRKFLYNSIVRLFYTLKKNDFEFIVASNSEVLSVASKFPKTKCNVVGLGVDDPLLPIKIRKSTDLLHIATIGRIHRIKRLDIAIRAVAILIQKEANKNVHLSITGAGDSKSLKGLIEELGISKNVSFTGWLNRQDLDEFLEGVDIVVQPSDNENFALSIAESIVRGIPVIVTDRVGMGEFVGIHSTGIVIPPNDEIALSRAMKDVSDDLEMFSKNCVTSKELLIWEHVFFTRWIPVLLDWK